jgi:dTDP-glucose pyrophosphorylase
MKVNSLKTSEQFWQKSILKFDSSIQQAISNLNNSGLKIVLVVNNKNEFIGTISDGDIRRGLLKNLNINDDIKNIIHYEALVVHPEFTKESALKLMELNQIFQIPIINSQKNVVGLFLRHSMVAENERNNIMVIMAGGIGKRLLPHTENCPKPMLKVSGKPILQHIIERAQSEGFRHFILSINYLGEMIEDYFGNGEKMGVKIDYIREKKPLGTAGALSLLNLKTEESFVVSNGDVITDIRYGELLDFHIKNNSTATMAVSLYEWQNPYGVVGLNGIEITSFDEKPINRTHINAGVYALSRNALTFLEKDSPCDMPKLFEQLMASSGKIIAYPMHEPWLDVGRSVDLNQANNKR